MPNKSLLLLTTAILFLLSCSYEEDKTVNESKRNWTKGVSWRANTFSANWKMNSSNAYATPQPIQCAQVISENDSYFAIDLCHMDSTLKSFDSLTVTYTSSIDLSLCIALQPEDKHGFEIKAGLEKYLPGTDEKHSVTFYPHDFGPDWSGINTSVTLSDCNNFGIGNYDKLTVGDTVKVHIYAIELF